MINPFGAETRLFQSNWVNTIAADALAPYYISNHVTKAEKIGLYIPQGRISTTEDITEKWHFQVCYLNRKYVIKILKTTESMTNHVYLCQHSPIDGHANTGICGHREHCVWVL